MTVGELRVPKNLEREDREVTIYAYRDMEWWSSHDSVFSFHFIVFSLLMDIDGSSNK